MARFKKTVAGVGVFSTPDGPAVVTPERLAHWYDSLTAILSRGHRPPLCWSHARGATPHPDDDDAFWRARFNAGKVVGVHIDRPTNDLVFTCESDSVELTPEGKLVSSATMPDGRVVRTEIEEVSLGAMDWEDGDGTTWKDVPIHLALTPLPVFVPDGGQAPFEPADDKTLQRFGTRLYRFATGGPPMAESDKAEKKESEGAGGGGVDVKKMLKKLAESGIVLPDDTTEANLVERLWVACTAVSGESGGGSTPPPAPAEGGDGGAGAMMSTLRGNPLSAYLLAEVEKTQREKRLDRIAALEKRGLPHHRAKALRTEATAVRFALTPGGTAQAHPIDRELDGLDAALPPDGYPLTRQVTPADVRETTPPEGAANSDAARVRKLADEQARNSRLPARK